MLMAHSQNDETRNSVLDLRAIKNFNKFRLSNLLCDTVLTTIDGGDFPIHRVLLSVHPYFEEIISCASSEEPTVVSCGDITRNILGLVLDHIYSGECEISEDTVCELLHAANRMRLTELAEKCWRFVCDRLSCDNCVIYGQLARKLQCSYVEVLIRRYTLRHFPQVEWTLPFMELCSDDIHSLLCDDALNAKREKFVFSAVIRWVRYNYLERESCLSSLLGCVRFGLTNPSFVSDVIDHPLIASNQDAVAFMSGPKFLVEETAVGIGSNFDHTQVLTRPREPPEVLFSIGGWSGGSPINSIETYDSRTNRWFLSIHTDSRPRAYHSLEVVDNKIYMLGGFDGTGHFNSVRCYDPVSKQWSERACMYTRRCYVSTCVLDGQIYAIGGSDGRQRLRTCERYDPASNQWQQLADMHASRSDAAAAVLRGRIYVAGGFNGLHVLDSVEVYDPEEDVWTFAYALSTPRSGISLLQWRDTLFALGGFDGERRLQSGERLVPGSDEPWQPITSMLSARSNFACAVLEDYLVVMGGFNGQTTIAAVERYDPRRDCWTPLSEMHIHRSALSACVLVHLENARHYSYLGHYDPLPERSQESGECEKSEPMNYE